MKDLPFEEFSAGSSKLADKIRRMDGPSCLNCQFWKYRKCSKGKLNRTITDSKCDEYQAKK